LSALIPCSFRGGSEGGVMGWPSIEQPCIKPLGLVAGQPSMSGIVSSKQSTSKKKNKFKQWGRRMVCETACPWIYTLNCTYLRLQLPALPLAAAALTNWTCWTCLRFLGVPQVCCCCGQASHWTRGRRWGGSRWVRRGCHVTISRLSSHHMPHSDWPRVWELNSLDSLDKAPQTQILSCCVLVISFPFGTFCNNANLW
jgi:hypothetical protein